jgi:hypothetical protein
MGLRIKYPLFLSDFNDTWIFSKDLRKTLKCETSLKSVQWEPSCSMRKDGRTDRQAGRQADMTKLVVVFRNFANAPENVSVCTVEPRYSATVFLFTAILGDTTKYCITGNSCSQTSMGCKRGWRCVGVWLCMWFVRKCRQYFKCKYSLSTTKYTKKIVLHL